MSSPNAACKPEPPERNTASSDYAESPSLSAWSDRRVRAYELKFLLSEAQACEVEARARTQLVSDPHADPNLGNAYRITSLYCDTARFDVFHRIGAGKRRKHRLRRYDLAPGIFLERKTRRGDRVRKRRTLIPDAELALLAHPMSVMEWPGHWFHRHLLCRQLAPVCLIGYERVALTGPSPEGPLRLTFDRSIRGALSSAWRVDPVEAGVGVLTGQVVCEFKYRAFLPTLFKQIIEAMHLTPRAVSKYQVFLSASGLMESGRSVDARMA